MRRETRSHLCAGPAFCAKRATLNFGHDVKLLQLSDRTTALIVPYCYRGDRKGQRGRGRAHTRTALTENWVICDQLSY